MRTNLESKSDRSPNPRKEATTMSRVICSVTAAAALALAGPAFADFSTTPHVAGSHQGWDAGANPMTDNLDGTFSATFTGMAAGERHEFKITDGTFDSTHPGGPNSWFIADGSGEITITLDTNVVTDGWSPSQFRLGLSHDPGTWTAVGDWQTAVGGSDWTNDDATTGMTDMGGGLYMYEADPGAGTWLWKAVVTGSWDAVGFNERSVNAGNQEFTLVEGETAQMWVNAFDGTIQLNVIPEPASLALMGLGGLLMLRRRA